MTPRDHAWIKRGRELQALVDGGWSMDDIMVKSGYTAAIIAEMVQFAAHPPDEPRPKWTYPDATTLKIVHAVREEIRAADVGAMSRIANV